ncbi:RidA family protein [Gordonibacter sp. Marseille-P4307]|uniref:RidA family protein n=1 Tax=Gordonibacter sp. Marseille-P4307 TaxID=2161815 RepID=UPI000F53130C|nr:RidA family protein [Gordonibacter sp. Marseille-P4307]
MSGDNVVVARNTQNAPVNPLYAQTAAFSHYNNLSAQLPVDPATGKVVEGGIEAQAVQCFKNIKAVVESIDHVMNDIVRITVFVKDLKNMDAVDAVYRQFFPTYVPSRTVVAVAALPLDADIQVEALVSNGEGTIPNAPQAGDLLKYTNNTAAAPLCALSTQSVAFSHYNNITAQLPIDPVTGQIVVGGVKEQAAQCLKNIKSILTSIDVPFDDIVKVNVFLKDLADLDAVNESYTRFFPDSGIARAVGYMPARTVVEVIDLPLHALVQIEAVVSHGDGTPPQAVEDRHGLIVEASSNAQAPASALSSQTVAFSHYNNISAQLGIDPATGALVSGGTKAEAEQCFKNIKAIIESVDHVMEDAVKVNIFLKDLADLDAVDEVYAAFFPQAQAARRVVGVNALPMDAHVQIDAIFGNAEGTPPVK